MEKITKIETVEVAISRNGISQAVRFGNVLFVSGEQNLLAVLRIRSIWKVAFLRLIALPLVVLCIFKYSGLAALVPDGQSILMISLLAASAPAAANVTQIAQVYGHEGDYAGAINVITTLLCIGTMPLMVLLYQM